MKVLIIRIFFRNFLLSEFLIKDVNKMKSAI